MDISIAVAPMLALALLAVVLLGSLLLVPLGLPGLWVMLGATLLYWIAVPAGGVGLVTLVAASIIVIIAEVLEYTIAGRYTRRFGGSSRASWGAIFGGLIGAVVGIPVPVVGSLAGAFIGSFLGAFAGELTVHRDLRSDPSRVATGALVGRAVAAAVKSGLGLIVVVLVMGAALVG